MTASVMSASVLSTARNGERPRLAVRRFTAGVLLFLGAALLASFAVQGSNDSKDEVFEAVDPYTLGERAGLDKAGYVGLGPFPLWEGARTTDVEEAIGRRALWVETAHFKVGSTLETYKSSKGDPREQKRVIEELKRLEPRMTKFKPPAGKLDPWLRLHLYARRLEDQYADFAKTFALGPADFPAEGESVPGAAPRGKGPWFGQAAKFVVLLVEKQSHFGRINARWFAPTEYQSSRQRMPGGGMLLVSCAETLSKWGFEQESALHSVVAADVVYNFCDGLCDRGFWSPLWFKMGLSHIAARRVDEKLAIYAYRSVRQHDADAWKWEPRVLGLVTNNYVPKWSEMMDYSSWDQVTGQGHLVLWSRVSWMLAQRDFDLKAWLFGISKSFFDLKGAELAAATRAHQTQVMQQVFGKTPEEMDAAWRQWVVETYKR